MCYPRYLDVRVRPVLIVSTHTGLLAIPNGHFTMV